LGLALVGTGGAAVATVMHLTLDNAILPLAVLVVLSIALPALLARQTLSQGGLALAVGVTALVVWGVGAGIMALLYAQINGGVWPGGRAALERSGLMALMWGPLLALVWLMRAQGVERRRGLLMRGDPWPADKATPDHPRGRD
jgi:hypothetical protein